MTLPRKISQDACMYAQTHVCLPKVLDEKCSAMKINLAFCNACFSERKSAQQWDFKGKVFWGDGHLVL